MPICLAVVVECWVRERVDRVRGAVLAAAGSNSRAGERRALSAERCGGFACTLRAARRTLGTTPIRFVDIER